MLITVLIIQIISGMVMVNVSTVQTTEKMSRACDQIIVALRFARLTAMSTGQQSGVEFNTSTATFRAFTTPPGTQPVTLTNRVLSGGTYSINLKTQAETNGVTISAVNFTTGTTNPYKITYGTMGGMTNCVSGGLYAEVTVSYGGMTRSVKVPVVGEPSIE
jgi:Tfp pilus assembly protein FimT